MPTFKNRPPVELKGLSYAYPGSNRPVLKNIHATVCRGEFIAVIGPNGSGKSTLARLISGLLQPTGGKVIIDGLEAGDPAAGDAIRQRVGLVLQNPDNQLVAAAVEEDVAFGPENLNLPPDQVRRLVDNALDAVGLQHLRRRPPHLLSGGEKQRLAIAGLLALKPSVLVLDEPTSMLDPLGRQGVVRVLRSLADAGKAVVMITHHMDEAARADRIWVLDGGVLAADDSPGTIFARERRLLRSLGLGLTGMAELACGLADRGVALPPEIVTIEDLVDYLCRVLKQKN